MKSVNEQKQEIERRFNARIQQHWRWNKRGQREGYYTIGFWRFTIDGSKIDWVDIEFDTVEDIKIALWEGELNKWLI